MRRFSNLLLLLVITLILGFSLFLSKKFLNTDQLLYESYLDQLFTKDEAKNLISNQRKWVWISYLALPLIVVMRTTLVALCLTIGNFFFGIDNDKLHNFKHFFHIALLAEFVLVLVGYYKFGYFYFIKTDYTLQDLQHYYPLSYINFLDSEKIEPWLIYPLQTINLFEVAYFFVLVHGMHKLLKNRYSKDFEITAVSYGSGLMIWMGLVMFLTLNNT